MEVKYISLSPFLLTYYFNCYHIFSSTAPSFSFNTSRTCSKSPSLFRLIPFPFTYPITDIAEKEKCIVTPAEIKEQLDVLVVQVRSYVHLVLTSHSSVFFYEEKKRKVRVCCLSNSDQLISTKLLLIAMHVMSFHSVVCRHPLTCTPFPTPSPPSHYTTPHRITHTPLHFTLPPIITPHHYI